MRASAWKTAALVVLAVATASADPKPKPVDIKAIRAELIVLTDKDGGIYVVYPGRDARMWYGAPKAKNLYEQVVTGRYSDGATGRWDVSVWAPRVEELRPGAVGRRDNGTYFRNCGQENNGDELTLLADDKAKPILDKAQFMSSAFIRRPHLLARDDSGVYYYVDVIRKEYGGKGYRVFVGKKGAMKQRPLTDIATDSAGDVFATKTGDLRMVKDNTEGKQTITWVKGEKRIQLSFLDTDVNSQLIFKDLGVYSFTGSICENF